MLLAPNGAIGRCRFYKKLKYEKMSISVWSNAVL